MGYGPIALVVRHSHSIAWVNVIWSANNFLIKLEQETKALANWHNFYELTPHANAVLKIHTTHKNEAVRANHEATVHCN